MTSRCRRSISLIALTAALLSSVLALPLTTSASARSSDVPQSGDAAVLNDFPIYDRTFYEGIDLGQHGAIRVQLAYALKWNDIILDGGLPPEADWKAAVQAAAAEGPGPVALDVEVIWLGHRVTREQAEQRTGQWIQLLTWAHEAVPDRAIGAWNFWSITVDPANMDLRAQIAVHEDLFFPHMYTWINFTQNCSDQQGWLDRWAGIKSQIAQVDSTKPVVPFIWPQYHSSCRPDGDPGFIDGATWRWELDYLYNEGVDGLYIYSGGAPPAPDCGAGECEWYDETVDFMNSLH